MSTRSHWEADILLNDGSVATIRPVTPDDKNELVAFYSRVSDQSKYFRFFSAHPELSDEDLADWLDVDGHDKVTLVAEEAGDIIAVASYSLIPALLPSRVGEVSFLVQDKEQGRGVGILLLEHLAEVGRERGIDRFTAEMLTQNRQMKWVFVSAGYQVNPQLEDGFITVDFPIAPSSSSAREMERRELRSESNSIRRLVTPKVIAVTGHSALASAAFKNNDFAGSIHTLRGDNPRERLSALEKIAGPVNLVVSDYDSELFDDLVSVAKSKGANGVLFATDGRYRDLTPAESRAIVSTVRDAGMRMLGPSSLGFINTHPGVRVNLSPHVMPRYGRIGIFAQTAGVATLMLSRAVERQIGLSTFISTGPFSDITVNDTLQFWSVDDATDVCLLSIDSIGNPRKFFRILRRLAGEKHVIIFMPSRAMRFSQHYADPSLHTASPTALDEVIQHAGAIVVNRRETMFDVAQILARQPEPTSDTVAIISNSPGLTQQMEQSAQRFGLRGVIYEALDDDSLPAIMNAVHAALDDPKIGAVVVTAVELGNALNEIHEALALTARETTVPLAASFVGFDIPTSHAAGTEARGELPIYDTYAEALEALSLVWKAVARRQANAATDCLEGDDPAPEDHSDSIASAREIIEGIVADAPQGRWATDDECAQILACYGITLLPWRAASSMEQACSAGEELGWDVVLKCVNPKVRARTELPVVIRHIRNGREMQEAWEQLSSTSKELCLGPDPSALDPVVQKNVPSGTSLTVRAFEDRAIGPLMSVGITGIASELLGDLTWRTPPLTRAQASEMLDGLKAAELLNGYRGVTGVDKAAVCDVLVALSALNDDNPAIAEVELSPLIAGSHHTDVVGAKMRIAPLPTNRDPLARTIS